MSISRLQLQDDDGNTVEVEIELCQIMRMRESSPIGDFVRTVRIQVVDLTDSQETQPEHVWIGGSLAWTASDPTKSIAPFVTFGLPTPDPDPQ